MEQSTNKMSWIAAYLCYFPPWETFLMEAVLPFVQDMTNRRLISKFFFVRYWDKGPHIRLRFLCDGEHLQELETFIKKKFLDYFLRNPSKEISWTTEVMIKNEMSHFLNNSIQFIPYEPEYERYGGKTGMLISESHFHLSSEIVLTIIESFVSLEYIRAIGIALQLQLSLLFSFGFNLEASKHFCQAYFEKTIGIESEDEMDTQFDEVSSSNSLRDLSTGYKTFIKTNEDIYDRFILKLWIDLNSGRAFQETWMNQWISRNQEISADFEESYNENKLSLKKEKDFLSDISPILYSLIHMTNNRMGIHGQDETLIPFILQNTLSKIAI
jgi:thiopeptide-type bacteriocin biosynthesis protein